MDMVEDGYGRPLAEYEELVGLLTAYRAMAERASRAGDAALVVALGRATGALAAKPCDIAAARLAVTTFRELVRDPPANAATNAATNPAPDVVPDPATDPTSSGATV